MRRTANTSVSPTIGMVVAVTGKTVFGPAWAAAGVVAAAPAIASAPVGSTALRAILSMDVLSSLRFLSSRKGPRQARALPYILSAGSVLDLGRQLAAIGRELGHHLLVQPDVHAGGVVGVAGVAQLLGEFLARRETGIDVERLHE